MSLYNSFMLICVCQVVKPPFQSVILYKNTKRQSKFTLVHRLSFQVENLTQTFWLLTFLELSRRHITLNLMIIKLTVTICEKFTCTVNTKVFPVKSKFPQLAPYVQHNPSIWSALCTCNVPTPPARQWSSHVVKIPPKQSKA